MNAFLVVARCTMDDIPMGLFSDKDEALAFGLFINEEDIEIAGSEILALDSSSPCNISLIPFVGGRPQLATLVKEFS